MNRHNEFTRRSSCRAAPGVAVGLAWLALSAAAASMFSAAAHAGDCEGVWDTAMGQPGINSDIRAFTIYKGNLIAAGQWTSSTPFAPGYVARWDGSEWQPVGEAFYEGYVWAVTVYNGELIAGGEFTTVGSVPANRIARWDEATGSWQPIGNGFNGNVYSLAVHEGNLIAAGNFTSADGHAANRVARWNGAAWEPLGVGIGGAAAFTLAIHQGHLVAAGQFYSTGPLALNGIARWDGQAWQDVGGGVTGGFGINELTVIGKDLYAGGDFLQAGGVPANRVARWDGERWHALGGGVSNTVNTLTSYRFLQAAAATDSVSRQDGKGRQALSDGVTNNFSTLPSYQEDLIVGGLFYSAGGVAASRIARWDGQQWHPLGEGITGSGTPLHALIEYDGELIAGGTFNMAGGQFAYRVAAWDGQSWRNLPSGATGPMRELETFDNELLAVGGLAPLSRWDGSQWLDFEPMPPFYIQCLAVFQDDLIVGVSVAYISVPPNGPIVYRWPDSRGQWEPIGGSFYSYPYYGLGANVLAAYDGSLVLGGQFHNPHLGIAHWDGVTPGEWEDFGDGLYWGVESLAVYEGDLIAGVGPIVSRWDGRAWNAIGSMSSVRALAVYNGDLIASGDFSTIGGQTFNSIARWDGQTWYPLDSGLTGGPATMVDVLKVYNGELYAGGRFDMAGGVAARNIARWNGQTWRPLGEGTSWRVHALHVHDGSLVVAGDFFTAGGQPANRIATWTTRPSAVPADLNCDGVVNTLDLGILLVNWSIPPRAPGCGGSLPCASDLNGDGFVNSLDLGILLSHWTL